ncbi:MAG: hypothetical protein IME98_02995, partial [Proteobacteria bacterium]|nr:hypothetical protein [Pseudomonadota bacterium]
MKRNFPLLFIFLALFILSTFAASESFAMPMFAKRIGRDCSYCHVSFPKLNETGRIFRANGFRFAEEEQWVEIKDMDTLPLAMEIEIEGVFNKTKSGGVWSDESDMKVEELEIMAGAVLGKEGKVSVLGVIGIEETATDYEPFSHGYIQINDLIGPRGEGVLNLKAGEYEVA